MDAVGNPPVNAPFLVLDAAARTASLTRTLASAPESGEIWVFGFGSLMWNPGFDHDRSHPAVLDGYQRKFHIWTAMARGTPECPGLGLCLEAGVGDCRGIAFRMLPEVRDAAFAYLWDREMVSGIYQPAWVPIVLDDGEALTALTFVVNRDHQQYAGPMPPERMAEVMENAAGKYGRCRDYLANTVAELAGLGVPDRELEDLLDLIDAR